MKAGGDPTTIARWINKAEAARADARVTLRNLKADKGLTADEIRRLLDQLPDLAEVFRNADPADLQDLLHNLHVRLVYDPAQKQVTASVDPCAAVGVGGPR